MLRVKAVQNQEEYQKRKVVKAMNKHVETAIIDADKVDGLMYAYEHTYLDFDVGPDEEELMSRAENTFYLLWDAMNAVRRDLKVIQDDAVVMNAVDEAASVDELRNQIIHLREENEHLKEQITG